MSVSLQELELNHLQCRSWAHAWEYAVSYLVRIDRADYIELHLTCLRCKAERIDTLRRTTGLLETRSYKMPDGYHIEISPRKEKRGRNI